MMQNYLWTEKYRPQTVADYVWIDAEQQQKIQSMIDNKNIPHLMFSGGPGTGKTTLAKILIHDLDVDGYDVLHINASRDNGVDFLKGKIEGFISTMPFGNFKVVLLDEADYLSHNAQAVLRGLMETYSASSRFIMTCNFHHKIIGPLKSRVQEFHINRLDREEYTARVATILIEENIEFDIDVLDSHVDMAYPDLRKCINNVQQASSTGKLISARSDSGSTSDYRERAAELIANKQFTAARKLLCESVLPDEMDDIFRWMYDNLDMWHTDPLKQDQAIIIICKGLVNNTLVADQEINLSSTLCELAGLHND
jgi:replication factor C small subunit